MLDELLLGGEIQETSKKNVLKAIAAQDLLQEVTFMAFLLSYSVFQGFSKIKSANGGSILSSSLFFDTAPAASKNKARFKSGQSRLKNNHLAT
jgi:hypothetical protein